MYLHLGQDTVIDDVQNRAEAVDIVEKCIDRYVECFCK